MNGQHKHEWIYNEAKCYTTSGGSLAGCSVIRFCPYCRKVERLELESLTKE